jgi:hypothetical protein
MRDLGSSESTNLRKGKPRAERHRDSAALVRKAIENIETKLDSNELKATIGDFIRLLQIEKELEVERPRDIKVTWVESSQAEPVSEE